MKFNFVNKTCRRVFIFLGLILPLSFLSSGYASISSVGYVHSAMNRLKHVNVPIPDLTQSRSVVSVKYLMKQIDRANEILNGFKTTDYANSDRVLDKTIVMTENVDKNIDELVQKINMFEITVTNISRYSFKLTAMGNFTIDWGDGTVDKIEKTNTNYESYDHYYDISDEDWDKGLPERKIRITGKATGYSPEPYYSAVYPCPEMYTEDSTVTFSGGLGRVFSTLPDGTNPRFTRAFSGCRSLKEIPVDLFDGISGTPSSSMFEGAFAGCHGLTSVPSGLFPVFSGPPSESMFAHTFMNCENLTDIPSDLFAGVSGPPADSIFLGTFRMCPNIKKIPAGLFDTISGPPAPYMFSGTFEESPDIGGPLPPRMFAGISGPAAEGMFSQTFASTKITGSVSKNFFGKITGKTERNMFNGTFNGCENLTDIEDGIWDLSELEQAVAEKGVDPLKPFENTFDNCTNITSPSPTIKAGSDVKLWEHFPIIINQNTFSGATQMADYDDIPADWK